MADKLYLDLSELPRNEDGSLDQQELRNFCEQLVGYMRETGFLGPEPTPEQVAARAKKLEAKRAQDEKELAAVVEELQALTPEELEEDEREMLRLKRIYEEKLARGEVPSPQWRPSRRRRPPR